MLLERQMTAASAPVGSAPAPDDDIEGRAALKTYLLESHGRMRTDPYAALTELCAQFGMTVTHTDDPGLLELLLGDLALWMDVTQARVLRLYTVGAARETDRVHEMLVSGTGLLECVWLPPRALEALARAPGVRMVLFSLRHDRRPMRRAPDENGIDSVTLRFCGPRAKETMDKLRHSSVLPSATSVYSVRVRAGDDERYCLAEVFHTGKITAVGTSFADHDRILRGILDEHTDRTMVLEPSGRGPRRITVPVPWTVDDRGYAVGRMFSGAEPFRLWGLPELASGEVYRTRAVDLDVGRTATFEVTPAGVAIELDAQAPASVAVRFISGLQYHINADIETEALSPEPLLQLSLPPARPDGLAFGERALMPEVARVVLSEACALWVRGALQVTTAVLLEGTHGARATDALHDLTRRVLSEAAAHEWRPWLRLVVTADGTTAWRFTDPLPFEANARLRELVRLNRAAQQLVARLSGTAVARWLQLSLFGPESMVTALPENDG